MYKKFPKICFAFLMAVLLVFCGMPTGTISALAESEGDGSSVYTFENLGVTDSAGAGYTLLGNILKTENGKLAATAGASGGSALCPADEAAQAAAENYTIKLYAQSESFTFKDIGLSAAAGSQISLKNALLVLKAADGSQIAAEALGDAAQPMGDQTVTQLSALFGKSAWAAENVAAVELTYTVNNNGVVDKPSFLRLENCTIAASANQAPVAADVQITGISKVGETLAGSYTYSDSEGDAEGASAFAWYRADDAAGTGEVAIEGATGKTYALKAEDVGKYITFAAVPRALTGTAAGEAAKSAPVGAVASAVQMSMMGGMDMTIMSAEAPEAGDGSSSNPYIIDEAAELEWMSANYASISSKYFLQIANIDMSGISNFTPIGNGDAAGSSGTQFTGQYDGQCFEIQNLTINSGLAYVGLFQYAAGTIKNVVLTNANITCTNSTYSYSCVSGIAAYANGTISNCGVGGSISLSGSPANGYNYAAGIAAYCWGTVENCYCTASVYNVNGAGSNVGGISAYTGNGSVAISKCYFAGSTSGNSDLKGGIVANDYLGTFTGNFYLTGSADFGLAGSGSNVGAQSTSDSLMKAGGTYNAAGWDFTNLWKISEGTDYPRFITTPGKPANFTAVPGDGEIVLDWDAATKASGYKIYYGTSAGIYSNNVTVTAPATAKTLTGLTNGTKYYFTVKALHTAEEGAAATEVYAVPHVTITDLAGAPDSGKVDLTFSAPAGAETVELQKSTDSGASYSAVSGVALTSASTSASAIGLANGTTYMFRLRLVYGGVDYYSNVITVNAGNTDNALFALTVSGCTLNETFSPSALTYTSSVGSGVSSISVTATLNSALATLKINTVAQTSGAAKTVSLVYGANTIDIAAIAENGSVKTYRITVTRAMPASAVSRDADASCDSYGSAGVIYTGWYAQDEDAALKFNLSSYSGTLISASLKIYVTSSDSVGEGKFNLYLLNSDSWTTALPASPTGSDTLIQSNITGLTKDSWNSFDVYSYVNSHLSTDAGKTVSFFLEGATSAENNDYGFYSTANATNKPYLVLVYLSNDARLSEIKIGGTSLAGFSPDTYTYNYQAPPGTDLSTLSFTSTINDAAAAQGDWTYNSTTKQWKMLVTAEDGSTKTYTVNVSVANAAPVASNVLVAGTYAYNQELTGSYSYSDYENNAEGVSTFQWYRSVDAAGAGKTPISGATSQSYTIATADIGKYISFEVTPVATAGTATGSAKESSRTLVPVPTVTVTFNAAGGSVSPATQTKLFNSTYGKASDGTAAAVLPIPTRTGYAFGGWWTGSGGTGSQIQDSTTVSNPSAHTVYAKWTANTYTVTFNAAGGSVSPSTQTKLYDAAYGKAADGSTSEVLPTPTRTGYGFGGWWTGSGGTGSQVTDATTVSTASNHTIFAKWTANTYIVTFNAEGGSVTPGTQTKLFDSTYGKASDGSTSEIMPTPTRTGYTFGGWWTASGGTGTQVTDATAVSTAAAHTLYAKWTGIVYTVTFDAQSGSVTPSTQNKLFGAAYGKASDGTTDAVLPTPSRAGYSFGGWWTGTGGTGSHITDATTVSTAGSHTLYAYWTANTYAVTFDAEGGSVTPATQTKLFDSTYGKASDGVAAETLPTPTKSGFHFGGWWTGDNGTGTQITDSSTVATGSNHTLYARWLGEVYTVTFDAQGGSVSPGTQSKMYGATYGNGADGSSSESLPVPTRTGYGFGGWWTGAGGTGTEATDATQVATAAGHTLYAKWTANIYTVTFDAEGGSVSPATQNKLYDSTYGKASDGTTAASLPTPARTGYSFGGWWTGDNGTVAEVTDATVVSITANQTLYAKWSANTYTVSFNAEGGSVTPSTQNKLFGAAYGKASDGTTDAVLPTPTRTGFSFGGWWTGSGGTGTQVTDATTVATGSNHTLYAKWTGNIYTVSFDAQGGSVSPASQNKLFASIYGKASDGTTDAVLPTPTRAGYAFGGWWTGTGGTGAQVTNATTVSTAAAHTLYAYWIANPYTVTFNAEGGSVSPATQTKLYDSTYGKASDGVATESLPTPTKSGYDFDGWWTGSGGTGTRITNTSTVATGSNHTLYAKWTGSVYTVTYDAEGGSVTPASQNKMYGAAYGKGADGTSTASLPTPAKAGHSFGGWWTGSGGTGTEVTNSSTVATVGNHTLYAKWTANTYMVSFYAEGGSVSPASQSKLYGAAYGKGADGSTAESLPTPTRSGYSFGGWWTAAGGTGSQVTDATTVSITAAQTLYAKWSGNPYTVTFDAGSGSVSVASQTKLFGSTYGKGPDGVTAAALPVATRDNYNFGGWWTGTGGTGTQITDATTVATAAGHTLYAKWLFTYTVSPISSKTMTELMAGYEAGTQETKTITITRTGTGDLRNLAVSLSGADASRFTVTQPVLTTLDSSALSTTFTVRAKTGLPIGVFEAAVNITAENMPAKTFTVSQTVKPLEIVSHAVTFVVYDGEAAVSGADVSINGNIKQTGTDGKAVFTLPNGNYAYSTAKTGYSNTQGEFAVSGSEKTICLVLSKLGEVVLPDSDGNTGAVLIADSGDVAQDVILMVDPLPAETADTNAIRVVSDSGEIAAVYDVYLVQQSARIQPNGTVRVGIPVPEGMEGKTLKVMRINDDGTVVEFEATVVGNLLFFTTDHFSKYAIVAESAATGGDDSWWERMRAGTTAAGTSSPKTGDNFAFVVILIVCIAAGAGIAILLVLLKRKRSE